MAQEFQSLQGGAPHSETKSGAEERYLRDQQILAGIEAGFKPESRVKPAQDGSSVLYAISSREPKRTHRLVDIMARLGLRAMYRNMEID